MSARARTLAASVVLVVFIGFAYVVVASSGDGSGGGTIPNDADGAFIVGLANHHKSTLEMAVIAEKRAEHTELREFATAMISERNTEIDELNAAHERIYGSPVPAGGMAHGSERPSAEAAAVGRLRAAKPFDRAFIDAMIERQEATTAMAETEIDDGGDPVMRRLATRVAGSAARESQQLQGWRRAWYGSGSQADR